MRGLPNGIDVAGKAKQPGMIAALRLLRELAIDECFQERPLMTTAVGSGHLVVLRLQMAGVEVVREEDQLGGDERDAMLLPRCSPDAGIRNEVEMIRNPVEETAERWECEATAHFDHVGCLAPQTALLETQIQHVHFGVAVVAGPGIPVAVEADEFCLLAERIFRRRDGFQGVERVAGVFDEEDATHAGIGIGEPEAQGTLIVQEPDRGIGAIDGIVPGAGIDACRHHQQVLI